MVYVCCGLWLNEPPPSPKSHSYVSRPPCGSSPVAENCTSSGAAPDDGSANASADGASGSAAAIEKATDLISSSLPALSVERYWTTWLPAAETVNDVVERIGARGVGRT